MVAITTVVAPSGERYEVKAGMVSWQCYNCVIHKPERIRGELFAMGRYTNPASFKQWRLIKTHFCSERSG